MSGAGRYAERGGFGTIDLIEQNARFVPFRRVVDATGGRALLFFSVGGPPPVPAAAGVNLLRLPRPRRGRGTGGGEGDAPGQQRRKAAKRTRIAPAAPRARSVKRSASEASGSPPGRRGRRRAAERRASAQKAQPFATREHTALSLDALRAAKQAAAGRGPSAPHGHRPLADERLASEKKGAARAYWIPGRLMAACATPCKTIVHLFDGFVKALLDIRTVFRQKGRTSTRIHRGQGPHWHCPSLSETWSFSTTAVSSDTRTGRLKSSHRPLLSGAGLSMSSLSALTMTRQSRQ